MPAVTGEGGLGRRKLAAWGVLAAAALVAGALVVFTPGRGGAPMLPVRLTVPGQEWGAAALGDAEPGIAPAEPWAPVRYVAGAGLPALGGAAQAYRLVEGATRERAEELAGAFGVEGPVVQDGDVFSASGPGTRVLVVAPEGGGHFSYRSVDWHGSAEGDPGDSPETTTSDEPVAEAPTPPMVKAAPGGVEPPAGMPSAEEAESIARGIYTTAGGDLEVARVSAAGGFDAWWVTLTRAVGGREAAGLDWHFTVGPGGEVLSAEGSLGVPHAVGTYQLLDTTAAIERVNAEMGGPVEALPMPMPMPLEEAPPGEAPPGEAPPGEAPPGEAPRGAPGEAPRGAPGEAPPGPPVIGCVVQPDGSEICEPIASEPAPPPPREVSLTQAEHALVLLWSHDGQAAYLVPAYRFVASDRSEPVVAAVIDDAIAAPQGAPPGGQAPPDAGVAPSGAGAPPARR